MWKEDRKDGEMEEDGWVSEKREVRRVQHENEEGEGEGTVNIEKSEETERQSRERWRQWVDRGITLLGYTECMF